MPACERVHGNASKLLASRRSDNGPHRWVQPDATKKAGICRRPKLIKVGLNRSLSLCAPLLLTCTSRSSEPYSNYIPGDFPRREMRVKCLEIHWHDGKPIATCDFQPIPFKKARPTVGGERSFTRQSYKLATGGEDNHVRVRGLYPGVRGHRC